MGADTVIWGSVDRGLMTNLWTHLFFLSLPSGCGNKKTLNNILYLYDAFSVKITENLESLIFITDF